MDDLIAFLDDQYAKDEQHVRAMVHTDDGIGSRWNPRRLLADIAANRSLLRGHRPEHFAVTWDMDGNPHYSVACGACGKDVDPEVWPCRHVRLLALQYNEQPGYREEWHLPADDLHPDHPADQQRSR